MPPTEASGSGFRAKAAQGLCQTPHRQNNALPVAAPQPDRLMKTPRVKKLRVLALMHPSLLPPETLDGLSEKEAYAIKTEYDIVTTLRGLGHEVQVLGVQDELMPIRSAVTDWKPQIVFNLLEEFHGIAEFEPARRRHRARLQQPAHPDSGGGTDDARRAAG